VTQHDSRALKPFAGGVHLLGTTLSQRCLVCESILCKDLAYSTHNLSSYELSAVLSLDVIVQGAQNACQILGSRLSNALVKIFHTQHLWPLALVGSTCVVESEQSNLCAIPL